MATLIFFCGHAGTGKTTLAKRVLTYYLEHAQPYCFLDKDTLYGNYSATVMGVLTGNTDDRDSPVYLEHLRNPEYQGLLEVAREHLNLGINTIVVGPFSQEVRAHSFTDPNWIKLAQGTRVKIVWSYVEEEEARRRIIARGDKRDAYKLSHWSDYSTRLFQPSPTAYPELILYDNTDPDAQQFAQLLAQLNR
jgi:predicted kinase